MLTKNLSKKSSSAGPLEDKVLQGFLNFFSEVPLANILDKYLRGEKVPENDLLNRLDYMSEDDRDQFSKWIEANFSKNLAAGNSIQLSSNASVLLGFAMAHGLGTKQNTANALALFTHAANFRNPLGDFFIADLSLYARDKDQTPFARVFTGGFSNKLKHYRKAKNNGSIRAATMLAMLIGDKEGSYITCGHAGDTYAQFLLHDYMARKSILGLSTYGRMIFESIAARGECHAMFYFALHLGFSPEAKDKAKAALYYHHLAVRFSPAKEAMQNLYNNNPKDLKVCFYSLLTLENERSNPDLCKRFNMFAKLELHRPRLFTPHFMDANARLIMPHINDDTVRLKLTLRYVHILRILSSHNSLPLDVAAMCLSFVINDVRLSQYLKAQEKEAWEKVKKMGEIIKEHNLTKKYAKQYEKILKAQRGNATFTWTYIKIQSIEKEILELNKESEHRVTH